MENKNSLLKHSMTYGLYVGLAMIIFSLIMYLLDQALNRALGFLSFVVLIGGMYYSMRHYRDTVKNGIISYGGALGYGVILSIFAGFLISVYSYIQFTIIDPGLIEQQMLMVEKSLSEYGLPDSKIQEQMVQQRKIFNSPLFIVYGILGQVVMGFIFALVLSFFIKKEPKDPFQNSMSELEQK